MNEQSHSGDSGSAKARRIARKRQSAQSDAEKNKPKPYGKNSPSRAIFETVQTLVTAYGPREAARQLNLNANTVLYWCATYGWKQAQPAGGKQETNGSEVNVQSKANQRPSEALNQAICSHKSRSSFAMGKYVAEASERAADSKGDLRKARQVRDLAAIHQTLWPNEKQTNLLAIGLLIGNEKPIAVDIESTVLPSGEA